MFPLPPPGKVSELFAPIAFTTARKGDAVPGPMQTAGRRARNLFQPPPFTVYQSTTSTLPCRANLPGSWW
jgi:hypothetical protein